MTLFRSCFLFLFNVITAIKYIKHKATFHKENTVMKHIYIGKVKCDISKDFSLANGL